MNNKPLSFKVTPGNIDDFAAFNPDTQGIPNYVHARTRVTNGTLENLNNQTDVLAAMKRLPIRHCTYIDYTGEGWVQVDSPQLAASILSAVPAYALVSPPDLFPSSGQFELSEWSRSNMVLSISEAASGDPPDSIKRHAIARKPATAEQPFQSCRLHDHRVSGNGRAGRHASCLASATGRAPHHQLARRRCRSFRPRMGCGRGSKIGVGGGDHLAAYALGSPFPEDAKLCAPSALSGPPSRRTCSGRLWRLLAVPTELSLP